jgi:hypothetical protein
MSAEYATPTASCSFHPPGDRFQNAPQFRERDLLNL